MNLGADLEQQARIIAGLKLAYQRMLDFKRQKNSVVVIGQEGKVVRIKP